MSYGLSSYEYTFKTYIDRIYSLQLKILKQRVPFKMKEKFRNDDEKLCIAKC